MTDLSKFVNTLIEYGEKIQPQLHKKYRPFIKSIINLKDLAKNVNPQKIKLTSEIIVFKLGIQSKSVRSIEISLNYLLKLFNNGFIDLNQPNYCEQYQIGDKKIEKKQKFQKYQQEMRDEILKLLTPLVHFKNNDINHLLLKIYQYIIPEPILMPLIQISTQMPTEQTYQILVGYFNYRFYLFEECYVYTEEQNLAFRQIPCNQKISQQIQKAMHRQQIFSNLMEKYVDELVTRVVGEGGKYGLCVVCYQPAQHYCKITKASLCGLDCKKKHLEVAEKQFKAYSQSVALWESIQQAMKMLCIYLSEKQSPFLFSVLAKILETPYLFMLIRTKFRFFLKKYIPKILDKAYQSKYQQSYQTLYFLMSYLAKWWTTQTLLQIEYFFKQNIKRVLTQKKPSFRHAMLAFKSLDKIFESGKTIIELYVNLDCEINRTNIIGQIMFQLSKIAQDKFQSSTFFSKQEKIALKNSCITLYHTFAKSLNQYRKTNIQSSNIDRFLQSKQTKSNLEQFRQKFNQHWSQGLKTLFNLNIVGLDSNQEIINIIMMQGGLKKEIIDSMLFDKKCQHFLDIFFSRVAEEPENLITKLLELYEYIPMTGSASIGKKKFVQYFSEIYKKQNLYQTVQKLTDTFLGAKNHQQFIEILKKYSEQPLNHEYLYLKLLNARKTETSGAKTHIYHLCTSHSYLEVISSQVSLLQIPLSYLLETDHPPQKILPLIKQLIPICYYSNWLSLLVKNSSIDNYNNQLLNQNHLKLAKGVMDIIISDADHIVQWQSALSLVCNLHYILTQNVPSGKKFHQQNRTFLASQLTVTLLDNCLINCSLNVKTNFKRFIIAVLSVSKQQLQLDRVFLLQKCFHILDVNLDKYLKQFDEIFVEYALFVKQLKPNNNETLIYISDMMKQFLLKLLKSNYLEDRISEEYFKLFLLIIEKAHIKQQINKEVGDFVMNCLSTIIMHHFSLQPKTWKIALKIMSDYAINYPYQTGVMIRKILNEKMENLDQQSFIVVQICFKLVDPSDEKTSIEAIHNIKMILDYQQNKKCQDQQLCFEQTKQLLMYSLDNLVELIDQHFNESVAEVIFNLLNFKIHQKSLLVSEEICQFYTKIFQKLVYLPDEQRQSGDRILNQSLFWCVKNRVFLIIKNLESIIIGQYTYLSISAMKCIKTYIQMANPRDQNQWRDIESTLLNIIKSCQVTRFFKQDNFQSNRQNQSDFQQQQHNILNNKLDLTSNKTNIDLKKFVHQCKLLSMSIQLLPNDSKCLEILLQTYQNKIKFNDDLHLRIRLWRQGLNDDTPPDLLALQEIVSNRIMAIYIRTDQSVQILQLCLSIFQRYIRASDKMNKLEQIERKASSQCDDTHYEYFTIAMKYWEKRRVPMLKLICYILPKLPKYCKQNSQRKQMMINLSKMLPLVEKRDVILKSMKQLSKKKY